jgi:hypothetical protein
MTLANSDLVQETTSTTGTGTLTLSGAVAGYQSFAIVGTGNTTYYCIRSGTNKEVGIGTYTASGTTLSRDTVLYSSAGGTTKITVAAGATVINTYPAETSVSGGGGGTYPTIQPSLNLDFANTKLLDPRITFVRNSTAAYYDGQTTALAEQNLLLQSNTFSNAAWVATNGTVASGVTDPAGTTTAFSFTATGVATLYQTLTTSATPYTLSFYIQRVTGTGAVNLTLDGTTLTPQTITGSWARYSVTATPTAASHTIGIQLAVITDSVNIFSSQLENRSSMTAANITTTAAITNYIPVLMTAPAGVARFDCDPITGKSLGLLIEEGRTNLLTYSSDFSNAVWIKNGATVTSAANVAPDGTQNAQLLVEDTSTGDHRTYQGSTLTSGIAYTFSVYAKSFGRNLIQLFSNTGILYNVTFNLSNGTIANTTAGTGTITPIGNGWYICSVSNTSVATTTVNRQIRLVNTGVNTSYTGDGYSGIYIGGAQLEAGSFATSYIPTVASTVTRAADQASITGTNFSSWYNQAQGSLYAESDDNGSNNNAAATLINMNTPSYNLIAFYGPGVLNQARLLIRLDTGGYVINTTSSVTTQPIKQAASFKDGAVSCTANGILFVTNQNVNIPHSLNGLYIGYFSGTASYLTGHIRKLSYYPVALSSSNLVALTS